MPQPSLSVFSGFVARACLRLALGGITVFIACGVQAQVTKKPAAPAAPNNPSVNTCSIAEFRTLALTTHGPQERGELLTQWLKVNSGTCSLSQILLLSSNRPQWMGTADSAKLAGLFDQIIESKLKHDPQALRYMYGSEGAASAGGNKKGGDESSGGAAATAAPMVAAPVTASAPPVAVAGAAAVPVVSATTPAAAAANINISLGAGAAQVEDLSRKLPLDSEAKPAFPAERGKQMKNYFGKLRAEMIRNYFMENSSPGNCPEGLSFSKTAGCESKVPVAWKFGEALPANAKTFPIPEPLLAKLSFYPGYQFVRVGTDILALEKDSGKVADAVLNFGKSS
jgi:hypothetical protein